ncbi:MAG: DUF4391 domain-containing protein [Eubacteriales bacterium]
MVDYFNLPINCIIDQQVEIDDFLKHAPISHINKATIKGNTLDLRILHNITPEKTKKSAIRLISTDYPEIQIISIKIQAYQYCKYEFRNFAWLFFCAIPYPLILIAEYIRGTRHYIRFASSTFHEGKIDISKNVQESIITSRWIDVNHLFTDDDDLLKIIAYGFHAYNDLYNIYSIWTTAFNIHSSGTSGNSAINMQEDTYRKKETRKYYNKLEEKRKQF